VWKRALQQTPDNEVLLGVISKFKGNCPFLFLLFTFLCC